MDAEKLFERRWALTLLEQARARLKEEYLETGKSSLYDRLKVFEAGDKNAPPYAQVAAELGLYRKRGEVGRVPAAPALSRTGAGGSGQHGGEPGRGGRGDPLLDQRDQRVM